jgi:hypothetical protein
VGKLSSETKKIETFLESRRFLRKLKEDQRTFKILSEGDLQSCVYYHIRKFLDSNNLEDWYLTNKLGMGKKKDSKKFPDIAIVHQRKKGTAVVRPTFLIELKEDFLSFKTARIKTDLKKLDRLVKKYGNHIQQAYFIYSTIYKKYNSKEINRMIEEWVPSRMKKKEYLIPITINIVSDPRNTLTEMENFIPKMETLRKFRG